MIVRLQEVSKVYGDRPILAGASLELADDDRVGLVGMNGAGKTTVLRLMLGDVEPDSGLVERARGARIGYLPQEVDIVSERSVIEEALSALPHMAEMESRLVHMEDGLGRLAGEELEKALEEYGHLREVFEREGGYTYRARAEAVLQGLGLTKDHWDERARHLSGGQKSRLMLGKLLLSEPDGLLLDEPTNHLDIGAIEWLENFLAAYGKAFIIVSHDRYFLDRTVTRMALLEGADVLTYPGNYTKFRVLHEAEKERQLREYEKQTDLIDRTKDFIRKNIAGQNTKQAKSRIKMLEKLDPVERPVVERTRARFSFKEEERSGEKVLFATDLVVGYPGKVILKAGNLGFRRHDRVGLVGPNGSGKTTLLKTLAGRLPPLGGEVGLGAKVTSGYFDQEQSDLVDDKTVIDTIWALMGLAPEVEVRSFLGLFDFSEERVFVKVGALSGGERGRLQLARIVKLSPNLLLLDEPTNHLDLHTREALEDALARFTGTMIVVSHDRYFLDRVCNTILAIEPAGLEPFPGNFTDYHHALERRGEAAPEPEPERKPGAPKPAKAPPPPKAAAAPRPAAPPPGPKKKGKREKGEKGKGRSVADVEREIFDLETEMREVSDKLAGGGAGAGELKTRYEAIQVKLQALYWEWNELAS
ncbi:MAG: ABC-F family ATP-binding cassette domain-containing protein [Acidobacteriota bacterium]